MSEMKERLQRVVEKAGQIRTLDRKRVQALKRLDNSTRREIAYQSARISGETEPSE